jgi:hypothetical protein
MRARTVPRHARHVSVPASDRSTLSSAVPGCIDDATVRTRDPSSLTDPLRRATMLTTTLDSSERRSVIMSPSLVLSLVRRSSNSRCGCLLNA